MSGKTQHYWLLFDEIKINYFHLEAKRTAEQAKVSNVMLFRSCQGKADLGASKLMALLLAVLLEGMV